jgi:hypothetical protein
MILTIDTSAPFNDADRVILQLLLDRADGSGAAVVAEDRKAEQASAPAAKKAAPARKAAAPKPEPEPEPEEDVVGDDAPTLDTAIERAQELVQAGKVAAVKRALALSGTKRVKDLSDEDIPAFLADLEDE